MKNKPTSILSSRMVALAFLFVFLVGSFGLATVALRQQIATSAAQAVEMERRLKELDRFEDRIRVELATAQSPAFLEAQNERFRLGLRQPRESQVVRVDRDTQIAFAALRWDQVASVPEEQGLTFRMPDPN